MEIQNIKRIDTQNIEYARWYSVLRRKFKQGMGAVGSIRNIMVSVASLRTWNLRKYMKYEMNKVKSIPGRKELRSSKEGTTVSEGTMDKNDAT